MKVAPARVRLTCLLFCSFFIMQPVWAFLPARDGNSVPQMAAEAAEILGVASHVSRLRALQDDSSVATSSVRREMLWHKMLILKKILLGYLQVRRTSDSIDVDLDYTYDAIDKEVRKRARRVDLANIANFTQFGVLLDTGASLRLKAFNNPATVLTCVSGSLTLGLSSLALALGRTGKSRNSFPPNALAGFFDLGAPPEYQLPDLINKFVNSTPPGGSKTRKEQTLELWKSQFNVDASRKDLSGNLASFPQKKHGESIGFLNNRLVLLYSLNALIEEFDQELLALLSYVESPVGSPGNEGEQVTFTIADELSAGAIEAAKLLKIQPQVRQLIDLQHENRAPDLERLRLEVLVLERTLGAALEVRKAVDSVDKQKHYQLDVVLADMTGKRNRAILLNNTLNFTQIGVLKDIAGGMFFNDQPNTGTELIMTFNGVGIVLSSLALMQSRGGKRKLDSETNVLAHFLNLAPPDKYRFSPLLWEFLNSVPPNSTGSMTRREQLIAHWQEHHVVSKTEKQKRLSQLAAMPDVRGKGYDTIGLINKRLRMLFDVRAAVEALDGEVLDLLKVVG